MTDHLQMMDFNERLVTFDGYWDGNETTATQLAAIGHICDRPPVEALEDGSHCIACNAFVRRGDSVNALEGPLSTMHQAAPKLPTLHHPNCIRLQVRIPLDSPAALPGSLSSIRMNDIRNMWEKRSNPKPLLSPTTTSLSQSACSLFSLPTELRLQIYSMILPAMEKETTIFTLNGDSARVLTHMGFEKIGPRDMTKINLLGTCRAVHSEALDIFFSNTTYRFDSTKTLYLFLRHIGYHGRSLLKSVDIHCGQREDAIAFTLLAACPKLTSITIRLSRWVLIGPRAPIWVIDGVAALLHLSGLKTVNFGMTHLPRFLNDKDSDAALVRRELMRPKGAATGVRWVDGYPDI